MTDDDERAAAQSGHSNLFNNFAVWSIRNPIPSILLFFLLCMAGLYGFHQMRIENYPDLDPSFITVSIVQPGASPAQMENEIALRVEDSIATIRGLKHISTAIRDSTITMAVEFRLEKDANEAQDDVRAAIDRVRSDLPDAMQDPIVDRIELSSRPLLFFAVESDNMDDVDLSWLVDHELSRALMKVRGVGSITRVGGVDRQIHVDIDHTRAAALGITAAEVSRALRNVQLESAGGKAELGIMQQPARTLGNVQRADELGQIRIPLSDGREIALADIATIRDTFARPESIALYDGRPVVGFEVSRSKDADEVATGQAVREAVQKLAARHPGLHIHETADFVTTTHQEYLGGMQLLYEGALLAVLVIWLFLRDFRATIIAATALPLSIIPAFAAMHWLDFTINAVTLLAISQVVGILVDDAIVEIENIVRHQRQGKTPREAAMEAATEIGLAVTATTFTLIAVFLPTAFMDGVVGRFFHQFGWTAALAVFASLVVARLLTPMMAAYTLRPKMPLPEPRWMHAYLHLVDLCLRHRFLTLLLALVFFAASLALLPLLPTSFMPPNDQSQTQVILELPPGADLSQTRAIAEEARQRIMQVEHVRGTYTTIAAAGTGRKRPAPRHHHGAHGPAQRTPAAAGHRRKHPRRTDAVARRANPHWPEHRGRKIQIRPVQRQPRTAHPHRAAGRPRTAHHPGRRQHFLEHQPAASGNRHPSRLCPRRRARREHGHHCRHAARRHLGRLRQRTGQAQSARPSSAHRCASGQTTARQSGRTRPPARARCARPRAAARSGAAGIFQRPVGHQTLRPRPQRHL